MMNITKMHGLGNDFIIIDNRNGMLKDANKTAKKLCERRLSVGADGLIAVENSSIADTRMRIYNSDGSEAEMCGNGIRCFAAYVYDRGIVTKEDFCVETLAGIMRPHMIIEDGRVKGVKVDMGSPSFAAEDIPVLCENPLINKIDVLGRKISVYSCLMGVPHTVVIVDNREVHDQDFEVLAPVIEKHEVFKKNTNVNFAEIIDRKTVKVRTWERGAGPTLACGTGSCATVCILSELGLVDRTCDVILQAGKLHIEYGDKVYLTGPAEYVFEGNTI